MNDAGNHSAGIIDQPWVIADTDLEAPRCGRFVQGRIACFSHRGSDKDHNEDAVVVLPTGGQTGIVVVADGLGGQPRGELAARTAVETMAEVAADGHESLRETILHGIDQANKRIMQAGFGGGATLAVLEIDGRHVRAYHVGDAFVLITGQRGKLKYQNIAHSPIGYAVESGLMDENDAVHHDERNLVSNVVGTPQMYIDIGPRIELAARDTVLVASDGLSDNLYVEEILQTIRTGGLPASAAQLRTQAFQRMSNPGGELPNHPDDLSFCLFRLDVRRAGRRPTTAL